jgi:hypothetical protein
MSDYYSVLEVTRESSRSAIQKSYRRLVKKYHPDAAKRKDPDMSSGLLLCYSKKFMDVVRAWKVLGNPEKREKFDRQLAEEERRVARTPHGDRPSAMRDDDWGHIVDLVRTRNVAKIKSKLISTTANPSYIYTLGNLFLDDLKSRGEWEQMVEVTRYRTIPSVVGAAYEKLPFAVANAMAKVMRGYAYEKDPHSELAQLHGGLMLVVLDKRLPKDTRIRIGQVMIQNYSEKGALRWMLDFEGHANLLAELQDYARNGLMRALENIEGTDPEELVEFGPILLSSDAIPYAAKRRLGLNIINTCKSSNRWEALLALCIKGDTIPAEVVGKAWEALPLAIGDIDVFEGIGQNKSLMLGMLNEMRFPEDIRIRAGMKAIEACGSSGSWSELALIATGEKYPVPVRNAATCTMNKLLEASDPFAEFSGTYGEQIFLDLAGEGILSEEANSAARKGHIWFLRNKGDWKAIDRLGREPGYAQLRDELRASLGEALQRSGFVEIQLGIGEYEGLLGLCGNMMFPEDLRAGIGVAVVKDLEGRGEEGFSKAIERKLEEISLRDSLPKELRQMASSALTRLGERRTESKKLARHMRSALRGRWGGISPKKGKA